MTSLETYSGPVEEGSSFHLNMNDSSPSSGDGSDDVIRGGGQETSFATPMYIFVTVSMFYGVIFLLGVVGNLMVVWIVLRNRDMRNATNVFLVNLCVADLLLVLICVPSALAEFYCKDVWYLGPVMCRLVPFLENTAVHASCMTILAISVERYYAICRPLKVRQVCTFAGTAKVVVMLWLFASLVTIPFIKMTFMEKTRYFDGTEVNVCRTHIQFPMEQAYIILTIVLFFAIPLFVLIAVYGVICHRLVKQFNDPSLSDNPRSSSTLKSRRQVVVMLVIVAVLFFVCLLPFKVISLWLIYAPSKDIEALGLEGFLNLLSFARIMHYINSSINPIVYNLVSTRFSTYFRKTFTCYCLRANGGPIGQRSRPIYWNHRSADCKRGSRKTATSFMSISNGDATETVSLKLIDKRASYL